MTTCFNRPTSTANRRSSSGAFLRSCATIACALTFARPAVAEDWLHWGGPRGDFTVDAQGLAAEWAAHGPRQIWKRPLGDGYSGILCKGAQLYTEYRDGDEAVIISLDAQTGSTKWEHRYGFTPWLEMEKSFGLGPNATPLIMRDRIVSISIDGHVRCLDIATGKLLWEHSLPAEFGRRKRVEEYGYSGNPLPYQNSVIVQVGGDDHAVVAFDPGNGFVVWKGEPGGVSYAPATITRLAGRDQYIYFEPEGVVGLDPSSGRGLWRSAIEFDNGNHLTPIVRCDDNHIWVASQFLTGGGRLLEITQQENGMAARQIWFEKKLRASHWTSISLGDYIYGSIGDNNVSFFAAFEWKTGKIAWRERGFHKAQSLYADGKVVFLDENGLLVLAKVSPQGLQVLGKTQLTESVSWTLPTLVGTTLYVRDRKHIWALDLGREAGSSLPPANAGTEMKGNKVKNSKSGHDETPPGPAPRENLPAESGPAQTEVAYFAGGCFWGIEHYFQLGPGVIDAVSGYMQGNVQKPTYQQVCSGSTGHAETVKVVFDPERISYRRLLEAFFEMHDPTQMNRQGPDVGSQYRSGIWYASEQHRKEAEAFLAKLAGQDRFKGRKIVTQVEAAKTFWSAEEYHQDYIAKTDGVCHVANPW